MTHSHDTSTPAMSAEPKSGEEFVLVPREPTHKMKEAGARENQGMYPIAIYRAMIAAAPAPNPSPAAKGGEAVREIAAGLERSAGKPLVEGSWGGLALEPVARAIAQDRGALSTPTEGPASQTEGMGGDAEARRKRASELMAPLMELSEDELILLRHSLPVETLARLRATLTPPETAEAVPDAHIDISGLLERHVEELRVHAAKLRWQMENDERPIPPHGWTCFHCAQTFTTTASASAHFGSDPLSGRPTCCASTQEAVERAIREWGEGPCDSLEDLVHAVRATLTPPETAEAVPDDLTAAYMAGVERGREEAARLREDLEREIKASVSISETLIETRRLYRVEKLRADDAVKALEEARTATASDPAPATDDRERLVEENKRLRDALVMISLTDWYTRRVRQHPDGGLRGMAGMLATRTLTGENPSYLSNEVIIERFGDPRASREIQPATDGGDNG